MISFEEFVMVMALTNEERRQLAEWYAAKRLATDQLKIGQSLAQSPLEIWISNQMQLTTAT